jgi:hypothetical protein
MSLANEVSEEMKTAACQAAAQGIREFLIRQLDAPVNAPALR